MRAQPSSTATTDPEVNGTTGTTDAASTETDPDVVFLRGGYFDHPSHGERFAPVRNGLEWLRRG